MVEWTSGRSLKSYSSWRACLAPRKLDPLSVCSSGHKSSERSQEGSSSHLTNRFKMNSFSYKSLINSQIPFHHDRSSSPAQFQSKGTSKIHTSRLKGVSWSSSGCRELAHDLLLHPGGGLPASHTSATHSPGQTSSSSHIHQAPCIRKQHA